MAYFSHLIVAIAIWSKHCQPHFPNEETEAQKKHITKRWGWIRILMWLQIFHPLAYLLHPCLLSECLCTARESPSVCLAHAGIQGGWTAKQSAYLSDSDAWKSLRRKLVSQVLISENIYKFLGRVLMSSPLLSFCIFWENSCLSMDVWVMVSEKQ